MTSQYIKPAIRELLNNGVQFLPITAPPLSDWVVDISTTPYSLRHKETGKSANLVKSGAYYGWMADGQLYMLHQLLAHEYIEEPITSESLDIDHIDRDKLNNSLDNLRYLPRRLNARNIDKSPLLLTDSLINPVMITYYKDTSHEFKNIFYSCGYFFEKFDSLYYRLEWREDKGYKFVQIRDINNNFIRIYRNQFIEWLNAVIHEEPESLPSIKYDTK